MLKTPSKVTINTGNVLSLIDIKKKAGQNVTEELSESIKLTLSEWGTKNGLLQNGTSKVPSTQLDCMVVSTSSASEAVVNITRPQDDVQNKMAEEERKNLKIGVKIFINEDSTAALTESLEQVFAALRTDYIENVILAYNPDTQHKGEDRDGAETMTAFSKASPISLSSNVGRMVSTELEADSEADARKCEAILPGIQVLWEVLENYVKDGRVQQLGVADVGGGCLYKLHAWARVKPTIAQINLASCCVVPPSLHAFCKTNDVQLLTHADPPDLLSVAAMKTLSDAGIGCNNLDWCARYQVHIKCRGVLALKGYVCKATIGKGTK
ncbi:glutamate--cysteine ligase regulatory subunit [Leptidea sinapis]|uniref:glutamate--cysteine ligase regulatory subunit n=1 Tax=Leptidea sinapis TaxID=189913 RepID=UPI00212913D0|nr:glutamate--cysteine ligase regulatory subunit [Leptidea sinapis]